MLYNALHSWDLLPAQAIRLQTELRERVRIEPLARDVELIAGADISYERYATTAFATFVVIDAKTLKVVDRADAEGQMTFPYVPGLLTFREGPVLLKAWEKLKTRPDLIIFDGQGIAHPRRLGIAAHMGLFLEVPSIGCGKSKLFGRYTEPSPMPGAFTELTDRDEVIGYALRTKARSNPLFISPGHMVGLDDALKWVQTCVRGYRLPEPTRLAHNFVNDVRRECA